MPSLDLPEPDADALAHSRAVAEHLRARIRDAGGWLPFGDYMREVLYAPGLGYYSAGAIKFGEAGDFVTAPEVSPLFGRCVTRQLDQILAACDEGAAVLELGAGSGALAAVVLESLTDRACEYLILEPSADLRERQHARIAEQAPEHLARVRWLDALPERFTGVVFGNEVLDALPVERFRMRDGRAQRLGVTTDGEDFAWEDREDAELAARVAALGDPILAGLGEGYCSELPDYAPLIRSLADPLVQGALLFVDYGLERDAYYAPARSDGTLACHYRHRMHDDPFHWPGLNDVTAWVEFTRLAEAGDAADLEFAGYTTQAAFLLGCGLEQAFAALCPPDGDARLRADSTRQVAWLTMPDEMGERFRAMAFTRELDLDDELIGFAGPDLAHRL